jgi:hypothetical protein
MSMNGEISLEKAEIQYLNRKEKYELQVTELTKAVGRIGSLRLLTFVIGIGITIYTYIMKSFIVCSVLFILSACIFIYLLIAHRRASEQKKHAELLRDINERSLKRIKGEWRNFEDDGSEFIDEKHEFSGDLDIFGRGSLFQWINTSNTYAGRQIMKKRLTESCNSVENIIKTQQAVRELSRELEYRQEYNAEGMTAGTENPQSLFIWGEEIEKFYLKPEVSILTKIMPAVTIIVLILSFTTNLIGKEWRSILICIQILLLIPGKGKRTSSLGTIYKYKDNIKVYKGMLKLLEQKNFKSTLLNEYKSRLSDIEGSGAADAIDKLFKICDMVSERKNLFFIIIDILLLWDYHCMIELEKWKLRYGSSLRKWLQVIGEFEALMSISIINFEHEDWAEPKFTEDIIVEAEKLGHPLLGEKRVCNDVSIKTQTNILLITGSNMSGKSTFLRTVGINLILAYLGAPVCAKSFSCSESHVYTCMRIGDNLEKSISSFYAEILRIKMIAEASKRGEKVFFLLDEIFKGTNSSDRHLGAKLLIKQLGDEGASGIVSTHDLELGEMEKEYGKIQNYHFQEYYENNELKFDYKLRRGVSTTRNALYLIKLAGIAVEGHSES